MNLFTMQQSRSFGRVSRSRAKSVLANEIKKAGSVEVYFSKLMQRRRETETGVINLPRRNFEDIMNHHVNTEKDYQDLIGAFYDYLGHRNTFP